MRIIIGSAVLAVALLSSASATFAASHHMRDHNMMRYSTNYERSMDRQGPVINDDEPLWSLHGLNFWHRFD